MPKPTKADGVPGNLEIRVPVSRAGANPWDIAAHMPATKPIKNGDVLLVAVWVRTETPPPGETTGRINLRLEETSPPYNAVAEDTARPGAGWQLAYASGKATHDHAPGTVAVVVHLAAAQQTICLGPAFILDFGPNYDMTTLPRNDMPGQPVASGAPNTPWSSAASEAKFAAGLKALRAQLPVAGRLLNDPSIESLGPYGPGQHNQIVADKDVPGGEALRVAVETPAQDAWSIGANMPVRGGIRAGDMVLMAYYANAREATNEDQSGVLSGVRLQQNQPPWNGLIESSARVPLNKWRIYYAYAVARADWPPGSAMVAAQLGSRKQTIDLGPVFVLDLGPGISTEKLPRNEITYPGREANAPWRAAADERIRKYRMGDLNVHVTDGAGKPLPGASVHIAMQRHAFWFGSFVGHNIADATGPDADHLRETFLKTFNFATSPIYWSDWGWQNPETHRHYVDSMKWLHDHGINWRGHPILYPREDLTPTKVKKLVGDPKAVSEAILAHVRDVVGTAKQYDPCCFDLINETRDGTYLPSISSDQTIVDAYKTAHAVDPEAQLFVNEYGIETGGGFNQKYSDIYKHWIETKLGQGAPLGGIGFQSHFGADLTDPARIIAILDDFSQYHLPIQITEFDVDTTDEQTQADYTRDYLTAIFSVPSTEAFIMWGWWEGDHWRPNAAMLRKDWSEKPNYKAWMNRIYHDWWTDETKANRCRRRCRHARLPRPLQDHGHCRGQDDRARGRPSRGRSECRPADEVARPEGGDLSTHAEKRLQHANEHEDREHQHPGESRQQDLAVRRKPDTGRKGDPRADRAQESKRPLAEGYPAHQPAAAARHDEKHRSERNRCSGVDQPIDLEGRRASVVAAEKAGAERHEHDEKKKRKIEDGRQPIELNQLAGDAHVQRPPLGNDGETAEEGDEGTRHRCEGRPQRRIIVPGDRRRA